MLGSLIPLGKEICMSIFVCGDIHSTLDIHKLNQFIDRDDLDETANDCTVC